MLSIVHPALKDVVDIALVAVFLYFALVFLKQTRSFFILTSVILLLFISFFVFALDLTLAKHIFRPILTFFFLVIIIVFQKEIRRFFEWFSIRGRRVAQRRRLTRTAGLAQKISQVAAALAQKRYGAIIVLAGEHPLEHATEGGIELRGAVSVPLLISLFDPHSPGHDGAVIIADGRIKAFGVHLPLAERGNLPPHFGTRHRAAIGITEETDALAVVISEERGTVSLAENGTLKLVGKQEFEERISDFLRRHITPYHTTPLWKELLTKNWREKIGAFILAVLLWFGVTYLS